MESFRVQLRSSELTDLNEKFPASAGSGDIGKRAIEIVKLHFQRVHTGCSFVSPRAGADMALVVGPNCTQYEVKGTAAKGLAWQQLKVSSQASHDLLTSGGAAVLRVTEVYSDEPVVYELRCGVDFRLEPEARWCVKPIR